MFLHLSFLCLNFSSHYWMQYDAIKSPRFQRHTGRCWNNIQRGCSESDIFLFLMFSTIKFTPVQMCSNTMQGTLWNLNNVRYLVWLRSYKMQFVSIQAPAGTLGEHLSPQDSRTKKIWWKANPWVCLILCCEILLKCQAWPIRPRFNPAPSL